MQDMVDIGLWDKIEGKLCKLSKLNVKKRKEIIQNVIERSKSNAKKTS